MIKMLVTGGGTGGHLYPALAIIDELKNRMDFDLLYVGTKRGVEANITQKLGIPFRSVWISGLHRKQFARNLLFPLKMLVSLFQSIIIVTKFNPDLVIGTGGYVTWPVLSASCLLGKKTALQEQNQFPGLVTRLLSRHVNQVHITFKDSEKYLKKAGKIILSGNPTRQELDNASKDEAYRIFKLNPEYRTLLIFGGSQGALGLNRLISEIIEQIINMPNMQVIWGTGPRWYEWIKKETGDLSENIYIFPFIHRMDLAYAAADLIVCRSGATTVAEINRVGVPAIYVPFPGSAEAHQEYNAEICVQADAAAMSHEKEGSAKLLKRIEWVLSDLKILQNMRENAKKLGEPDAAEQIVNHLMELLIKQDAEN